MTKILSLNKNLHWWLIGVVAILLLLLEGYDYSWQKPSPLHVFEFVIYMVMLVVIGILLSSSFRIINSRTRMNQIIEYKHKLSLEFSMYTDWEVLVTQLARFPGSIADVEQSFLYVRDSISNKFTLVAVWPPFDPQKPADLVPLASIDNYLKEKTGALLEFSQCVAVDGVLSGDALSETEIYCLPVRYGQGLLGTIGFKIKDGCKLTSDQQDVFKNVGDEIGFALKAGQDRRATSEMSTSETTLAERRRVSQYLHDHLGNNLGYLHFKLDQMIANKDDLSLENVLADLDHMREAASESYDIMRGTLESMQPTTTPMLTNLLMEHASKISQRANIEIDFQKIGKQALVSVDVKRVIFYVFEEALSNAVKHAQASKINVLIEWSAETVAMTISDNGVGFNPDIVNTDQHFGLLILRERLEQVDGQISLVTTEKLGTRLTVRVPIQQFPHRALPPQQAVFQTDKSASI